MGITKRGDPYLRMLLIHGARSVVYRAASKQDSDESVFYRSARADETNCTSFVIAQASSARLQNSLALSTVMLFGTLPRSCRARSNACATFIPVVERSASSPTHSRVN